MEKNQGDAPGTGKIPGSSINVRARSQYGMPGTGKLPYVPDESQKDPRTIVIDSPTPLPISRTQGDAAFYQLYHELRWLDERRKNILSEDEIIKQSLHKKAEEFEKEGNDALKSKEDEIDEYINFFAGNQ